MFCSQIIGALSREVLLIWFRAVSLETICLFVWTTDSKAFLPCKLSQTYRYLRLSVHLYKCNGWDPLKDVGILFCERCWWDQLYHRDTLMSSSDRFPGRRGKRLCELCDVLPSYNFVVHNTFMPDAKVIPFFNFWLHESRILRVLNGKILSLKHHSWNIILSKKIRFFCCCEKFDECCSV